MASGSSWTKGLAWIVVLAVVGGGGYWAYVHFSSTTTTAKAQVKTAPVPVTTALVRKADFPVYLTGLGTVEPYDTVTVNSRVDGEITKVFFRQGQMVKEGDTLAKIDPRPYQAALDQALAKKAADEATLKNATLNLARYKTLGEKEFASQQQLDTQQASVDQLQAQIKGDQAAIDNAQTQVSYTTIKAPLSGKTGFRIVDPGNIVHASGTDGHRDHRQAAADLGRVHRAGGGRAAHQRRARRGERAGRGVELGRQDAALEGSSRARQQHGRPSERRHPHEGDLRQRRQPPVARACRCRRGCWCRLSRTSIVVPVDAVQRGSGRAVRLCRRRRQGKITEVKVDQEGDRAFADRERAQRGPDRRRRRPVAARRRIDCASDSRRQRPHRPQRRTKRRKRRLLPTPKQTPANTAAKAP